MLLTVSTICRAYNPNSVRLQCFKLLQTEDDTANESVNPDLVKICKLFFNIRAEVKEALRQPDTFTLDVQKLEDADITADEAQAQNPVLQLRSYKGGKSSLKQTGKGILSSLLGFTNTWFTPSKTKTTSTTVKPPKKKARKTKKQKTSSKCRWSRQERRLVCPSTIPVKTTTTKTTTQRTTTTTRAPTTTTTTTATTTTIAKPKPTAATTRKTKQHHSNKSNSWDCPVTEIDDGRARIIRGGRIHRYYCHNGYQIQGRSYLICNCKNKRSRKPSDCNAFALSGSPPVCQKR